MSVQQIYLNIQEPDEDVSKSIIFSLSRKRPFNQGGREQLESPRKVRKFEKEGTSSPRKLQETRHRKDEEKSLSRYLAGDQALGESGIPKFSSLFTGNPCIPCLPKVEVNALSEEVFSKDSFDRLNLAPQLELVIENLGFTSMTVVQQKSIPILIAGKDALIKSQTGSGKTLAYAVPIIHKLMKVTPRIRRSDGIYALIIVPTRELAQQSYKYFDKLCKSCIWVVPGYLIGGEKKKSEKARLRKGINILVATPGRLIDHIASTKCLSLASVKYLVIDEADRLLDMGYEESIMSIINSLNEQQSSAVSNRQTIMLSATLTVRVQNLAGMSLSSPEIIDVSSETSNIEPLALDSLVTPKNLSHFYAVVPAKLRLVSLSAFILQKCQLHDEGKILVFMATQDMVDYHTELFSCVLSSYKSTEHHWGMKQKSQDQKFTSRKIQFLKLHGNMNQKERSSVFNTFRETAAGVLLCTDVAARGLDLPKVNWIIQYNPACTTRDYVHRVGRTARVDEHGSALIFLTPAEAPFVTVLGKHSIRLQEMPMERILYALSKLTSDGNYYRSRNSVQESATALQVEFENHLLESKHLFDLAKKGFISFVRSYMSYPREVRGIFNFKNVHLGHYTKSFALKDSPSHVRTKAERKLSRQRKYISPVKEKTAPILMPGHLPKVLSVSEYGSGLGD